MPLVFGGAPIVNVLVSMVIHPPKAAINPMLYVGFLLGVGRRGDGAVLPADGVSLGSPPHSDCLVIGASFAGLACATALARAGMRVTVLERKADAGEKLHTTGIIVKDAIDQIALLDGLPSGARAPNRRRAPLRAEPAARRSRGARLLLPRDRHAQVHALAGRARRARRRRRSRIGRRSRAAQRTQGGFDLGDAGTTRYLVGADGPASRVAKALGLGLNTKFLFGVEHEYAGVELAAPDRLHCFLDRRLAPGYIGWVVAGVGVVQVGLAATRPGGRLHGHRGHGAVPREDRADRSTSGAAAPASMRAGMIPCGGVVESGRGAARDARRRRRRDGLAGDGRRHSHGAQARHWRPATRSRTSSRRQSADPSEAFVQSYPRFRAKRLLRFLFDRFQSDAAFNLLLGTRPMRAAASIVYFHRKGAFDRHP